MEFVRTVTAVYLWRKARKEKEQNKIKRRRRFWVRPIFERRRELGAGQTLVEEMKLNPDNNIYNFFRMNASLFHNLLELVGPQLQRSDLCRAPINPQTRLAITLRCIRG
ncbi:uncharacterized protein LOC123307766 [Coccinella septempunctata]|uniref:uncharacterized protein LOC123307766 n=1 Tax=Coccinella septempunctata TaxID=41139 RepID=UPI001D086A87|nr:uncharacterized protein LOC123307766 [Coccinella septempunctata]